MSTTVTLQEIKAAQADLAALIAKFEASDGGITLLLPEVAIELAHGEHYAGTLLDDDGEVSHHLVLLAGERESIKWQDAMEWAAAIGGELPSRREQSLLFANLKSQFQAAWYWSAEPHETAGEYAWDQGFFNGNQDGDLKSYEGRARAVRRVTA